MYYFIAIVKRADAVAGNMIPFYTLYKANRYSEARSGWRVIKHGSSFQNMRKVIITNPYRHKEMIEFMSSYRTRDHMHNTSKRKYEASKKYYPQGVLCWFTCDANGQRAGPVIVIKRVPQNRKCTDNGWKRRNQILDKEVSLADKFTLDTRATIYKNSCVKPILYQQRTPGPDKNNFYIEQKSKENFDIYEY